MPPRNSLEIKDANLPAPIPVPPLQFIDEKPPDPRLTLEPGPLYFYCRDCQGLVFSSRTASL